MVKVGRERYLAGVFQNRSWKIRFFNQNFNLMKDCEEKTSSFLLKLLNMLRSKQNAKTIAWDLDQSGIRVINQEKLEDCLLPRYFRHNRFSSFVRQLNMYDFHKVYLSDNSSIFYHQVFNPRDKQSIYKIKRKAPPHSDSIEELEKSRLESRVVKKKVTLNKNEKKGKQNEKRKNKNKDNEKDFPKKDSSFKILFTNSKSFNEKEKNQGESKNEQVLEEILNQISPLNLPKESIREKVMELRGSPKFKKVLKSSTFLGKVYSKLGIEMELEDEKLSQLSIQEQLMFDTKKSLTLKSLKLFESGPLNLRGDTLAMFLS